MIKRVIELKRVLLTMALMVLMSMLASAENESVTTGPYNLSFDLAGAKNSISYQVDPVQVSTSEDLSSDYKRAYYFNINISKPSIRKNEYLYDHIDVELVISNSTIPKHDEPHYKKEIYNLLNGPREAWCFGLFSYIDGFDFSLRIIDGSPGYVGTGTHDELFAIPAYAAIFSPPIDPDHVECRVFSMAGWDEGTLQFLKTIHIEKIAGKQ